MSLKPFSAVALLAVLGVTALAPRDAAADHSRSREGVCVYEHADFRGWEMCFGAGESLRDLGDRRNSISSIRIQGGARISLFEHPQFGGREVQVDNDVSDLRRLGGWNDQVDSLRVSRGGDWNGPRDRPRSDDRNREDRVCVYEHANYLGASRCFDSRDDERNLTSIGWNDRISSIRTFGRSRLEFFEHTDYQGQSFVADRDIPDLTRIQWNDRISSLRMGGGRWDNRR